MSEFKEFKNPEAPNYDLESMTEAVGNSRDSSYYNPYDDELMALIGIINDPDELHFYGITWDQYCNPDANVLSIVRHNLEKDTAKQLSSPSRGNK